MVQSSGVCPLRKKIQDSQPASKWSVSIPKESSSKSERRRKNISVRGPIKLSFWGGNFCWTKRTCTGTEHSSTPINPIQNHVSLLCTRLAILHCTNLSSFSFHKHSSFTTLTTPANRDIPPTSSDCNCIIVIIVDSSHHQRQSQRAGRQRLPESQQGPEAARDSNTQSLKFEHKHTPRCTDTPLLPPTSYSFSSQVPRCHGHLSLESHSASPSTPSRQNSLPISLSSWAMSCI